MEDKMKLDEYMTTNDDNAFWRLSSGDHQNLLDEAIERMQEARGLLADALLPRDHGVYWCARDVDQAKIDRALGMLVANADG
jgi:hypothetical protein